MKVVYECTKCNNKITFQFIGEYVKFNCPFQKKECII